MRVNIDGAGVSIGHMLSYDGTHSATYVTNEAVTLQLAEPIDDTFSIIPPNPERRQHRWLLRRVLRALHRHARRTHATDDVANTGGYTERWHLPGVAAVTIEWEPYQPGEPR